MSSLMHKQVKSLSKTPQAENRCFLKKEILEAAASLRTSEGREQGEGSERTEWVGESGF